MRPTAELELLASARVTDEPLFAVLHRHGPGGVSKGALMRMFAQLAEQPRRKAVRVDGDLPPNPPLQAAVGDVLSGGPGLLLLDAPNCSPRSTSGLARSFSLSWPPGCWR